MQENIDGSDRLVSIEFHEINQAELARKTGMTQSAVNRILHGRVNPSLASARKLAHALGITLDEFDALLASAPQPKRYASR